MLGHFLDGGEHGVVGFDRKDCPGLLIEQLLHGKHDDLRRRIGAV
jgi:hypothetical protein